MKQFVIAAIALVGMATAGQAGNVTLTWNFDSPTGVLGTSETYTENQFGMAVTAYGYTCTNSSLTTCSAMDLYGKNNGPGEEGLGLANGGDNEIQTNQFIQLNLTNLLNVLPASETLTIDSVQLGEGFAFYQSSTLGSVGTLLNTFVGTGPAQVSEPLSINAANGAYISVAAYKTGDVAINSLSASVDPTNFNSPEPATLALVGGALIGLASLRRRRKV